MAVCFYKDLVIETADSVYEPREDSFLIADNLNTKKGEKVLEIGTGSGILAILAAKMGSRVTAVDINEDAIEGAAKNAKKNDVWGINFCTEIYLSRLRGKNLI